MVTAHADGTLQIFPHPGPQNGAGGGTGGSVDASCPVPGGGVHKWLPRTATLKAHKGGITCCTALVGCRSEVASIGLCL